MPAAAPVEHAAAAAIGQQPVRIPRGRLAAPRLRPEVIDSDESDSEERFVDVTGRERDCKLRKTNSSLSNRKKPQNRSFAIDETTDDTPGLKAAASSMRNHSGQEKAAAAAAAAKKRNIFWPRSSSNRGGPLDDDEDVPNWTEAASDFSKDRAGSNANLGKLSGIQLRENTENVDSEDDKSHYSYSGQHETLRGSKGRGSFSQSSSSAAHSHGRPFVPDNSLEDAFNGSENESAKGEPLPAAEGRGFSSISEGSSSSAAQYTNSVRSSAFHESESSLPRNLEPYGKHRAREHDNSYRKHERNERGNQIKKISSNKWPCSNEKDKQIDASGIIGNADKVDPFVFQSKTNFNFRFDPTDEGNASNEQSAPLSVADASASVEDNDDGALEDEENFMEIARKKITVNDNEWSSEEEVAEVAEEDVLDEMLDIFEDNDFLDAINARGEHLADLEIHIALDEVLGIRPNRPWYGQLTANL